MTRAMLSRLSRHWALKLGTACLWMSGIAHAETVSVLDQLILGETRLQGEKIGEFSSLVALPDGSGLIGISDRGYIAEIAVGITGEKLSRVEVTAIHILTGQDGAPVADAGFSPEAATFLPDGGLAIVDETTARVAVFDLMGAWLRDDLLPEALSDVTRQASDKDGVEALAWTEATGFIAVTEEPQAGQTRDTHTFHTALAGAWTIQTAGPESVSIKGMEVAGAHLFVLERTRDNMTDALYPFVRIVDLAECQATTCDGKPHPIPVTGITDADFEGIAALGGDRFLIVSDDKIDGDLRSVFVLLQVE
jgi:hypothetical protein